METSRSSRLPVFPVDGLDGRGQRDTEPNGYMDRSGILPLWYPRYELDLQPLNGFHVGFPWVLPPEAPGSPVCTGTRSFNVLLTIVLLIKCMGSLVYVGLLPAHGYLVSGAFLSIG